MQAVYTIDQIKDRLTPVFRKNNVRKAILFGSYGKGHATSASDVDILVDSGLPGLAFFGLMEDACQSLECPLDMIDTQDLIPDSAIDREIKTTLYHHPSGCASVAGQFSS